MWRVACGRHLCNGHSHERVSLNGSLRGGGWTTKECIAGILLKFTAISDTSQALRDILESEPFRPSRTNLSGQDVNGYPRDPGEQGI